MIARRTLVTLLLIAAGAAILAFLGWRLITGWAPSRDQYPVQGIAISAGNAPVDWHVARAKGVNFAYLTATYGADRRDGRFSSFLEDAAKQNVRTGAVHRFSLCRLAADQAALFITTVPRSSQALPAVLALDFDDQCVDRPGREIVLSEISTFLNQIETHSGKPVVLRISADFEKLYQLSGAIDRTIWLEQDYFPPNYAAKPWVMWTVSKQHRVRGVSGGVDWIVVRP